MTFETLVSKSCLLKSALNYWSKYYKQVILTTDRKIPTLFFANLRGLSPIKLDLRSTIPALYTTTRQLVLLPSNRSEPNYLSSSAVFFKVNSKSSSEWIRNRQTFSYLSPTSALIICEELVVAGTCLSLSVWRHKAKIVCQTRQFFDTRYEITSES